MALAFVKATKIESGTGTSWGGTVTATAGNLLLSGAVTSYGLVGTGINTTDASGGNTWTRDANGANTFASQGGSKNAFSISSAPNATGGTYSVTFTPQGGSSPTGGTGSVYEFSGAPTASPNDATSPALATGDPSTTALTGSLTNTTANAVFLAMFGGNLTTGTSTVTGAGTGWTYPANGLETNATSFLVLGSGYKIVSSVAGETSSWTITSQGWGALIAVYKAAAAAASQVPYDLSHWPGHQALVAQ